MEPFLSEVIGLVNGLTTSSGIGLSFTRETGTAINRASRKNLFFLNQPKALWVRAGSKRNAVKRRSIADAAGLVRRRREETFRFLEREKQRAA